MAYLIRTGGFKAGDQLPSIRSLAADAKINYNTVAKAYRDLELAGLIVSIRGRGMFVQKGVSAEDEEDSAIDALLESCIRRYLGRGMTYDDVRDHMNAITTALEQKAHEAEEEKQSYGNA